jgi:hypothetical protein
VRRAADVDTVCFPLTTSALQIILHRLLHQVVAMSGAGLQCDDVSSIQGKRTHCSHEWVRQLRLLTTVAPQPARPNQ